MKNYISSVYGVNQNESLGEDLKKAFKKKKNVYANFLRLYPIIRSIVNFYDPILLGPGPFDNSAPLNEYDIEINDILDCVELDLDLKNLTQQIEDILLKWFGGDNKPYYITEDKFNDMCLNIHEVFNHEIYKTSSKKHVLESLLINANFLNIKEFNSARKTYQSWISEIENQKEPFFIIQDLILDANPNIRISTSELADLSFSLKFEIENAVFLQSQYDKFFLNK